MYEIDMQFIHASRTFYMSRVSRLVESRVMITRKALFISDAQYDYRVMEPVCYLEFFHRINLQSIRKIITIIKFFQSGIIIEDLKGYYCMSYSCKFVSNWNMMMLVKYRQFNINFCLFLRLESGRI